MKSLGCLMNFIFKFHKIKNANKSMVSAHYRSIYSSLFLNKDLIEDKKSETIESMRESRSVKTIEEFPLTLEEKETIEELKKGNLLYPYKNSVERTVKIVKEDLKVQSRKAFQAVTGIPQENLEVKYFPRHTDILIIGSGIAGLSAAYFIMNEFPYGYEMIVVDKKPYAPHTTLTLTSGTITQQNFMHEHEIEMAKFCCEFLSEFPRHSFMKGEKKLRITYEPMSALTLANETNAEGILQSHKKLNSHKIPSTIIGPETMKKKYPWLNVEGVEFGWLNTLNEGLIDPYEVATCMKCKLANSGVKFVTAEAIDFGYTMNRIRRIVCRLPDGTYNSIDFGRCIIAAGKETGKLINKINEIDDVILKVRIPEENKTQYEYCFHNPEGPGFETPILTNVDGTYFRREGLTNLYVVGVPPVSEIDHQEKGPFHFFEHQVKPFLTSRLVSFKDIELTAGWMQSYSSNKANEFGILGWHPCNEEISFMIGFTKKGFLYALAAGRALMEIFLYNRYKTLDLTDFQIENLWRKQHLEAEKAARERLTAEIRERLASS